MSTLWCKHPVLRIQLIRDIIMIVLPKTDDRMGSFPHQRTSVCIPAKEEIKRAQLHPQLTFQNKNCLSCLEKMIISPYLTPLALIIEWIFPCFLFRCSSAASPAALPLQPLSACARRRNGRLDSRARPWTSAVQRRSCINLKRIKIKTFLDQENADVFQTFWVSF